VSNRIAPSQEANDPSSIARSPGLHPRIPVSLTNVKRAKPICLDNADTRLATALWIGSRSLRRFSVVVAGRRRTRRDWSWRWRSRLLPPGRPLAFGACAQNHTDDIVAGLPSAG